jgi:hypothetical protein
MKLKKKNLIQIWKSKGQILEGIRNSVFKNEDVEEVARHRMIICKSCPLFDEKGEGCMVPGTQPCCNEQKGGCGCSLNWKTKSLSSECPKGLWKALLTLQEEDLLQASLNHEAKDRNNQ